MYRLSGSGIRFLSTLLLMIGEICLAEQIEKPFCHYFTYWGSFNFLSQRRAQRSSFIRKRKQVHEPLHKFLLFVSKDLCSRFHHKFLPLPFAFALPFEGGRETGPFTTKAGMPTTPSSPLAATRSEGGAMAGCIIHASRFRVF